MGFFFEYTRDAEQYDTDPALISHFTREALRGANEITEDVLQIDLINGAGAFTYYCGAGNDENSDMGETAEITYNDLVKIAKILQEKGVAASRMTVESFGDTVQPFPENDKNRCVIVVGE